MLPYCYAMEILKILWQISEHGGKFVEVLKGKFKVINEPGLHKAVKNKIVTGLFY